MYQRLLAERHGIVTPEQRDAWSSAWDRAEEIKGDVEFEPYDHLSIYLTGCTEKRHRASAVQWMRFFIEDRSEFIVKMHAEMERASREVETPQEREDRYNRRLPPITTLVFCPGCGAEPTTEPHREGCHRAAATTGEKS